MTDDRWRLLSIHDYSIIIINEKYQTKQKQQQQQQQQQQHNHFNETNLYNEDFVSS